MSQNLSPALNILSKAEQARQEGFASICEFLSPDPNSVAARILEEIECPAASPLLGPILEEVSTIIEDHCIQWDITDWPFEHFWGNPYEPKHSALLRYFIDPLEKHGCGLYLLRKFLKSCNFINPELPVDETCEVTREDEHIDLLVTRNRPDGRYGIIFENKINWAQDQDNQLHNYVELVHQRGFEYNQIFVYYLPLTKEKHPEPTDLAAIRKSGVNYGQITFETHILNWLNLVLEKSSAWEWPPGMRKGMVENLQHYRDLIKYLNKKKKELEMDNQILKLLGDAEKKSALPTWTQVERLQKSAAELKKCLESMLRGKTLLEIRRILQEQGEKPWLCLDQDKVPELHADSHQDEQFEAGVNICLRANEEVIVCFGGNDDGFWFGYMRSGSQDRQTQFSPVILQEAKQRLIRIDGENSPWYAWAWKKDLNFDNCVDKTSMIAAKLVEMRNGVADPIHRRHHVA